MSKPGDNNPATFVQWTATAKTLRREPLTDVPFLPRVESWTCTVQVEELESRGISADGRRRIAPSVPYDFIFEISGWGDAPDFDGPFSLMFLGDNSDLIVERYRAVAQRTGDRWTARVEASGLEQAWPEGHPMTERMHALREEQP